MTVSVADSIVTRLRVWGVQRIFGYPGDGISGLLGAIDRAEPRIPFVQARHDEMAAFMACAHARFTGEIGVCVAASGPGVIRLLNGQYDDQLDRQPVIALVGQQSLGPLADTHGQDHDLENLLKDAAGGFVQTVTTSDHVVPVIDDAVRSAIVERTATCVILPSDLQEMAAIESSHRDGFAHGCGSAACQPDNLAIVKRS
jgi:pyruvate dehydrogenase (quinone)